MTTLRQAAEMALDVLIDFRLSGINLLDSEQEVIAKLQEALAQPEQEPVAYRTVNNHGAYVYHSADRLPNEHELRGEALYLNPAPIPVFVRCITEIRKLRAALAPLAAIDLCGSAVPDEFAFLVLRARDVLKTPNAVD